MPDLTLQYRGDFLDRQSRYDRKYKILFGKVADDIARLVNDPTAKFTKSFRFNKTINNKIDFIIENFQQKALDLNETEIRESWKISGAKNSAIIDDYLKTFTAIKAAQEAAYYLPNTRALNAFISGKHGAETLSQTIWKVAEQLRGEMEIHLGLGILNGDSAPTISRRIRQYLNEPEAYFRRVRDAKGNLVASKAMIANAPGQGKYNSAFKNAMRVARSTTNQAYLLADSIRWQQLDMVIGVKISLSAQHRIYDICDECQGTYPKDFVFTGWHSQCLCNAVPILMPKEDFDAYLKGDIPLKAEQIKNMPSNFESYIRENYDKYMGYKTTPFFIQDNREIINKIVK